MPPIPPKKPERKERLAVNLHDLHEMEESVLVAVFGGKLDLHSPVKVDPSNVKDVAVPVDIPLLLAATVIDVAQSEQRKVGLPWLRTYIFRGIAWTKLPRDTLLTVLQDGVIELNPDVFGAKEIEAVVPRAFNPVTFG